jgi:SAM-dependent methyltransferase
VDCARIYQAMRQNEMNAWVGGDDPEFAGEICASILLRHVPAGSDTRLLDFGAGIGRVALAVLRQRPQLKSLTGFDIVPRMVQFCQANISSQFPNANFELVADRNAHYERYQDKAEGRSRAELIAAYKGSIDSVYAFSVFTHVDAGDFVALLQFMGELLKPGGRILFTVFALTPYSRNQIATGRTSVPLPAVGYEQDGTVFIPNAADRLSFVGYDIGRVERMVVEAGLIPSVIEYGDWRGDRLSATFQDVVVCRKPLE